MSETAELTATEVAMGLLPLLKEYAAKMADVVERVSSLSEQFEKLRGHPTAPVLEACRWICLHDTLDRPVREHASEASGLIEHSKLEFHLHNELKLRLYELEENIRFSKLLVSELIEQLKRYGHVDTARKFIKKSGRYDAPF